MTPQAESQYVSRVEVGEPQDIPVSERDLRRCIDLLMGAVESANNGRLERDYGKEGLQIVLCRVALVMSNACLEHAMSRA